jgi:disulfide bond formation protein DsbB
MSGLFLPRRTSRLLPLLMAAACVAGVGAALVSQHVFDMRPCPWCVLQRLIFLTIAMLCIATSFAPWRRVRLALNAATLLLSVLGITAAVYQHEVAAKMFSCNLTFADKVLSALGLETLWPAMFQVTATCAEAAVTLLGVPFEFWSLTLFSMLGLGAATLVLRSVRVEAG